MSVDLFHGHRGRYALCRYWKGKESPDLSEFDLEEECAGEFYARPENSQSDVEQTAGRFQFGRSSITISTSDDVGVERNDAVLFRGSMWLVESVQRADEWGKSEYESSRRTYIGLRK